MREGQVFQRPTVDPQTAASGGQEQTDSQPTGEGVIKFSPTAKYEDPDKPGEVIDGNLLKTRINQGYLVSDIQSQRDKAVARAQQLAQEVAKRDQQLADLQKQIAAKEQEEVTISTLKRLGIKPESQDTGNSESSWFTEQEQPQLTQQQILQELGNIKQELRGDMSKEVQDIINRHNQENLINQQSQQRVSSFVSRTRQADEAQLRADLPDLPDSEITQIATLSEVARALEMKAQEAARDGDLGTAEEAYIQAQARAVEARNLQAQAMLKQQELAAQKEIEQQTEMFAPGGSVFKEIEESKESVSFNKAERKKAQEEHLAKVRELEKQMRRLRSQ